MESIWQKTTTPQKFETLQGKVSTDVLIIGGGMAGILTAYFLKQKGIEYILVEGGKICGWNTQNTTAKITFQHGLVYHKILKSNGLETAKAYLLANKAAFETYASLCKKIDCDYQKKDNFVYTVATPKKLNDELEALDKIGYKAELCKDLPLPIKTDGAVKFANQAEFNPLKFAFAIAKNLNIYENTFVREMIGTIAITDKAEIKANRVIVATHFPFINKHGSYFLKLYQHRSYVIALKNAADVKGMYVDDSKTGLSFRNYKDYLLLGGGGHRTGKKGGNWNELRQFARIHYPTSKESCFWAAQDCMSLDNMPYIGQYSRSTPNLYVASGFNKWGMTGSMLAAMLLSDMMAEKQNDFAKVFNPSRSIMKPQLLLNGGESVMNLLTPTSKRCPHLGCALKWNRAEHTWDCPCHGSRFSSDGSLLDNPSNGDLKLR